MEGPIIKTSEISVEVKDKPQLIKCLQQTILQVSGNVYVYNPNDKNSYFLKLDRNDCGCSYIFRKPKDLPVGSLFCKHLNQIIRYTSEELTN